jgi:hypothetical protein
MSKKGEIRIFNGQKKICDGKNWRPVCLYKDCIILTSKDSIFCKKHRDNYRNPPIVYNQKKIIQKEGNNILCENEYKVVSELINKFKIICPSLNIERKTSCAWDFIIHFCDNLSTMVQIKTSQENSKYARFDLGNSKINESFKEKYGDKKILVIGIQYYINMNNNIIINRIFINIENSINRNFIKFSNIKSYNNSLENTYKTYIYLLNFIRSMREILNKDYRIIGMGNEHLIEYKCNLSLYKLIPTIQLTEIDGNKFDAIYNNLRVQIKVMSKNNDLFTNNFYNSYYCTLKKYKYTNENTDMFILIFRTLSDWESCCNISYVMIKVQELIDNSVDIGANICISTTGLTNNWIWKLRNKIRF